MLFFPGTSEQDRWITAAEHPQRERNGGGWNSTWKSFSVKFSYMFIPRDLQGLQATRITAIQRKASSWIPCYNTWATTTRSTSLPLKVLPNPNATAALTNSNQATLCSSLWHCPSTQTVPKHLVWKETSIFKEKVLKSQELSFQVYRTHLT